MFEVLQHKNLFFVQYYKDVCVVPNSCVYLRFQVFYFLFFRFLPFVSEVFNFRSDKRFQIFFCVPVFDSVFQSRIFSAINNNSFRNFSVSEFRAFRFSSSMKCLYKDNLRRKTLSFTFSVTDYSKHSIYSLLRYSQEYLFLLP